MLPQVNTSFYKPLWASVLHLFQQRVRDLYKALVQAACTFYNSVDDRVTYASVLEYVDRCKHVLSSSRWMWSKCRWHIDSYSPALQTWDVGVLRSPLFCAIATQKLPGFSRTSYHWLAACEPNPHETTTISHRVQVQFSFGTIYNINLELSNKWAEFES